MHLVSADNHFKALKVLQKAEINTLFVETIAKNHLKGKMFVDCLDRPEIFYICHPYHMSFLCGPFDNSGFNGWLIEYMKNTNKKRKTIEWLQAYPDGWNKVIQKDLAPWLKIEDPKTPYDPSIYETGETRKLTLLFERVNFQFDENKYLGLRETYPNCGFEIRPTDAKIFESFEGAVIPKYFWNNAQHFENFGTGFTLFENDIPLSTSFSSCKEDNFLEIGIETQPGARGKGLALQACIPLIEYCIEHNLEPLWSCHSGNIGSIKLAERLGFSISSATPYYRLGV